MDLQTAKMELLFEAARNGNKLSVVEKADSKNVMGHALPLELRQTYVAALDALVQEGSLKSLFKNRDMQVFLITADAPNIPTLISAKQRILQELETHDCIYKIHSENGEYVQFASVDEIFAGSENVRILYMQALGELLRSGKIDVKKESREMCTYTSPKRSDVNEEQDELESKNREVPFTGTTLELCA